MRHELRKICGHTWLVLLLLFLVVGNAVAFYKNCISSSMAQQRRKYDQLDTLPMEQTALETQLLETAQTGDIDYEALTQILSQIGINHEVLNRVEQTQNYQTYRQNLMDEAEWKLQTDLFDGNDSFSVRSLRRGVEEYSWLADVNPPAVFLGGVELFLNFRLTDGLLLSFPMTACLLLLSFENRSGLSILTRPTRNGRANLWLRKLGTAVFLLTVGFSLLYGSNLLIVRCLYGLEHLSAPIQSLYGFANCPLKITVGGLLARSLTMKYLCAMTCVALTFLLCVRSKSPALTLLCIAICIAIAVGLAATPSLWARNLSLAYLLDGSRLYREAVYLNLFSHPVSRPTCGIVFLLCSMVFLSGISLFIYARIPQISVNISPAPLRRGQRWGVGVFGHELRKVLVTQGGLFILLLLLAVQVYSAVSEPWNKSEIDSYYRRYSQELAGKPNREKDTYLAHERERFAELDKELARYAQQYTDSMGFELASREIQTALRPAEAFYRAESQYMALRPGQSYLYQTGYDRLFGPEATRSTVLTAGKAVLAMILLFSGVFANERETGVYVLQRAAKLRPVMLRSKTAILLICSAAVTLVSFLPRSIAIAMRSGGFALDVQANSAQVFAFLPDIWTLGMWFTAILLGCWLALCGVGCVVFGISRRVRSTVSSVIISSTVLLIPLCTIGLVIVR